MNKELINKILKSGVWYKEYGEKELKHTCNLKIENLGQNGLAFCNKNNYFPFFLYKKQFWLKKDKSE